MEEIYLSWSEFVNQYSSSEIEAKVDLNKGHAFMKLPFAPEEWRLGIKIMTFISIILLPVALVLFFFVRWWIPVLLILIAIPLPNAIRKEAAKAVLSYSLKDEKFYERAIFSQTLKLFRKKEGKMKNP